MKNIFYTNVKAFRLLYSYSPGYWWIYTLSAVLQTSKGYWDLYMTARIVTSLATAFDIKQITIFLSVSLLVSLIFSIVDDILDNCMAKFLLQMSQKEDRLLCKKTCNLNYCDVENAKFRQWEKEVREAAKVNGYGVSMCISCIKSGISTIISWIAAVVAVVTLARNALESGAQAGMAILLLGLIVGIIILRAIILIEGEKKESRATRVFAKGITNVSRINGTFDSYKMGKDIRLYELDSILLRIREYTIEKRRQLWRELCSLQYRLGLYGLAVQVGQACTVYLWIGKYILRGILPVGSFVSGGGYLNNIVSTTLDLIHLGSMFVQNHPYLEKYLQLLDFQEYDNTSRVVPDKQERILSISHLSFRYDNMNSDVLHDISLDIEKNRKYAIVGRNGSGKTTFVKLLCHLYSVDDGMIRYYGCNPDDIGCDKYWENVSSVFQDFKLLSLSLGKNIALTETPDVEKIETIFRDIDFWSRYQSLGKGLDTPLHRDFEQDGVEVSGGEEQKIALARALYKDAELLFFDEPTAALDPKAECAIYENLNRIVKDKTLFFVSHRLASCKFCDTILVFDQGRIVQKGSHEELLKDEKGLYYTLWMAQASQYMD